MSTLTINVLEENTQLVEVPTKRKLALVYNVGQSKPVVMLVPDYLKFEVARAEYLQGDLDNDWTFVEFLIWEYDAIVAECPIWDTDFTVEIPNMIKVN